MRLSSLRSTVWLRGVAIAGISALGIVTLVGSGGGASVDGGNCGILFSNTCNPTLGPLPAAPAVEIAPSRMTAQVGATVTLTASAINVTHPSYRWFRLVKGGSSYVEIPGAVGSTYTLAAVNLTDDGSSFEVVVSDTNGSGFGVAGLSVSSMPGVVFEDGEFQSSNWQVTAVQVPAQGGATYDASQATSGGNPGAFRRATYDLPVAPGSVRLFHSALSALYTPTTQGAIYTIDFAEDCIRTSTYLPSITPMIEQGGRRFTASTDAIRGCADGGWHAETARPSLSAQDFVLYDGPTCGVGESCPDFSASAAPIRLGLVTAAELTSPLPANTIAHFEHGFDNWRVTVWRK